jgi:hypothetical protein
MTRSSANSFIDQDKDELYEVKSESQEPQGLDVPCCFLDQTIRFVTRIVQVCPIELVFNLGEVGICERNGCRSENAIISTSIRAQRIDHKINRKLKHVSAIPDI